MENPQAVPKLDAMLYNQGLEAVEAISLDEWKRCFALQSPDWQPEMRGDDSDSIPSSSYRPAAVLILVQDQTSFAPLPDDPIAEIKELSEPSIILTRRTMDLPSHAGQISFPGGRVDPQDTDVIATALREAEEEVGLDPALVEILGVLPLYRTRTRYAISPVVGWAKTPLRFNPNRAEVAEIFSVPLSFLLNPAHHHKHRYMPLDGIPRDFYAMPWGDYFIWGATAAMLRNLYHLIRKSTV